MRLLHTVMYGQTNPSPCCHHRLITDCGHAGIGCAICSYLDLLTYPTGALHVLHVPFWGRFASSSLIVRNKLRRTGTVERPEKPSGSAAVPSRPDGAWSTQHKRQEARDIGSFALGTLGMSRSARRTPFATLRLNISVSARSRTHTCFGRKICFENLHAWTGAFLKFFWKTILEHRERF